MKKIGILTLSASDNCGSLLQTYALQTLIAQEIDDDVLIIDFSTKQSKNLYSVTPKWIIKYPGQLFRHIVFFAKLRKQKRDYTAFRNNYLRMSKATFGSSSELSKLDGTFDTIVVGSDQVWNVNMSDFDQAFMLDWVKRSKKVGYAISVGGSPMSDKYSKEQLHRFISSFDALSFREDYAKKQAEELTGKKYETILDPTLVVGKDIWYKLSEKRLLKNDYIFFYSWGYSNHMLNNTVKEYAEKHGLKVYVINANKWVRNHLSKYGFKLFSKGGPLAFLNLMRYAKIVFVESFHGIIFANLFEKDFYFLNNKDDNSLDPRIENVLTLFNKKDRSIRNYKDIISCQPQNNFFDNVELKKQQDKSLSFLKNL